MKSQNMKKMHNHLDKVDKAVLSVISREGKTVEEIMSELEKLKAFDGCFDSLIARLNSLTLRGIIKAKLTKKGWIWFNDK